MASAKVLDARQVPSTDTARRGKLDWLIVYQIDNGPVTPVFIHKDPVTDADIQAAIKDQQTSATVIKGKTFTV